MPNPAPLRAAEYVLMSTEHQQYSIANQSAAIARYASARGMQIVRSFVDARKSGLKLAGREALQELIGVVQGRQTDFDHIFVYDVSRWGRFQDVDESAFYEYICKRSGITVHYCAEPLAFVFRTTVRKHFYALILETSPHPAWDFGTNWNQI